MAKLLSETADTSFFDTFVSHWLGSAVYFDFRAYVLLFEKKTSFHGLHRDKSAKMYHRPEGVMIAQ